MTVGSGSGGGSCTGASIGGCVEGSGGDNVLKVVFVVVLM